MTPTISTEKQTDQQADEQAPKSYDEAIFGKYECETLGPKPAETPELRRFHDIDLARELALRGYDVKLNAPTKATLTRRANRIADDDMSEDE